MALSLPPLAISIKWRHLPTKIYHLSSAHSWGIVTFSPALFGVKWHHLLHGYHNFNFTPTPTGAGGVGFYLKDIFDYDLRPDLKLNLSLCEDIWF